MNFKIWLEFTEKDIPRLAKKANLKMSAISKYDKTQIVKGLNVEKEHDKTKSLDVVDNEGDILKIALAHLKEKKDYYDRLKKVEK